MLVPMASLLGALIVKTIVIQTTLANLTRKLTTKNLSFITLLQMRSELLKGPGSLHMHTLVKSENALPAA